MTRFQLVCNRTTTNYKKKSYCCWIWTVISIIIAGNIVWECNVFSHVRQSVHKGLPHVGTADLFKLDHLWLHSPIPGPPEPCKCVHYVANTAISKQAGLRLKGWPFCFVCSSWRTMMTCSCMIHGAIQSQLNLLVIQHLQVHCTTSRTEGIDLLVVFNIGNLTWSMYNSYLL